MVEEVEAMAVEDAAVATAEVVAAVEEEAMDTLAKPVWQRRDIAAN